MSNEVALTETWANKLAAYAADVQTIERPQGQFFSTKSGVLTFAQQPLKDNTVDVIVIGSMHENVYYPEAFNADAIAAPTCYAFTLNDVAAMKPHDDAEVPQSPTCATCKWNQYKSAANGKGKACKNMRRLALMPVSALSSPEDVMKATVGYLRVPVTSVKFWIAHAQFLASSGFPPFSAVTRIKLHPDPKTMLRFSFDTLRRITEPELLAALERRFLAEQQVIGFPYPKRDPVEATQGGNKGNKF